MKKLIEKIILYLYIRKADYKHFMTGSQVFVVPVVNYGKQRYTLMTKQLHDAYNKKARKMRKRQISYYELLQMCVYKTKPSTTWKR